MVELERAAIERVKRTVQERFAGIADVEPTVQALAGGASPPLYVLTFRQEAEREDGGRITRTVRVTVDGEGKIVKLSASR